MPQPRLPSIKLLSWGASKHLEVRDRRVYAVAQPKHPLKVNLRQA